MTAEEARIKSGEHYTGLDMEDIYFKIECDIERAVESGEYTCVSNIYGCDKPWEQIYRERDLIKEHFEKLGYTVECLGYCRPCMWDEYRITW